MHLIEIIPHGGVGKRGAIMASSVAEALEGWSRQQDFAQLPMRERPVLEVVDFETEEKLRAVTEVTQVHVAPAMFGGGGFGRIVLGAVLIASAFMLPGVGIAISSAVKGALLGAGIGMALGGIIQLFLKAPTLGRDEDPEPSKYLGLGRNTTEIGTLIGFGGGRMMVGGQYLSMQVNSSDLAIGTYPNNPN